MKPFGVISTGSKDKPLTIEEFKSEAAKLERGQSRRFYLTNLPTVQQLESLTLSLEASKHRVPVSVVPDVKACTIEVTITNTSSKGE